MGRGVFHNRGRSVAVDAEAFFAQCTVGLEEMCGELVAAGDYVPLASDEGLPPVEDAPPELYPRYPQGGEDWHRLRLYASTGSTCLYHAGGGDEWVQSYLRHPRYIVEDAPGARRKAFLQLRGERTGLPPAGSMYARYGSATEILAGCTLAGAMHTLRRCAALRDEWQHEIYNGTPCLDQPVEETGLHAITQRVRASPDGFIGCCPLEFKNRVPFDCRNDSPSTFVLYRNGKGCFDHIPTYYILQIILQTLTRARDDGTHPKHSLFVTHGLNETNIFSIYIPRWMQTALLRMLDVTTRPEHVRAVLAGDRTPSECILDDGALSHAQLRAFWEACNDLCTCTPPVLALARGDSHFYGIPNYDQFF